jgi:molecular chaperone DnaK
LNGPYGLAIGNSGYRVEEILAVLLNRIKTDAEERLHDDLEKAVITVPAYFSDSQRRAIKTAGEIAGFEVARIVNEPTAASMAHGFDDDSDQTILVYDLGGGTFSVAVLDLGGGVYEVVATNGDNTTGGDDWDWRIVEWAADTIENDFGVDLRKDDRALRRLKESSEEAKIELSSRKETTVAVPPIAGDSAVSDGIELTLHRDTFESLTESLTERSVKMTEQALDDAGYSAADIDEVVLVGGATRMPQVVNRVEEITGQAVTKGINPDEAVALGAAIQAGVYSGEVDDIVLLDVTPLSLGIETASGQFERIIDNNTTIPTEESEVFTTARDDQTSIQLRVFQGEREEAETNELLGEFELTDISPSSTGRARVEVTFEIDETGIVNVAAEDLSSGTRADVTFEGGNRVADDDLAYTEPATEARIKTDQLRLEPAGDGKKATSRNKTTTDNSDNRTEGDRSGELLDRMLAVRDNLGRALEEDTDVEVRAGVEATLHQFDRILERENISIIAPSIGAPVDPRKHEVVQRVSGNQPPGTVAEVYQPGYETEGDTLRPARVAVIDRGNK